MPQQKALLDNTLLRLCMVLVHVLVLVLVHLLVLVHVLVLVLALVLLRSEYHAESKVVNS